MSIAVLRLSVALWLIGGSLAAEAGDSFSSREYPRAYRNRPVAIQSTVWYCASSGNLSIVCRLGGAGGNASTPRLVQNSHLPAVAREVIEEPEALEAMRVEIPLHAPPFDFALVGQLAEFVMCGNRDLCGVVFGETLAQLDQLVRLHESARRDGKPGSLRASAL